MVKNIFFCLCLLLIFGTLNAQQSQNPVKVNGQLHIKGSQLLNEQGESLQLAGMSLFWSQWQPQYYNQESIGILKDYWNVSVVRAAMGVEHGGYLDHPKAEKEKVFNVIDAAITHGIYVIVDWHDHKAEEHITEAKTFFREVAEKYGDYPHLIYEVYNEPLQVSWDDTLKPYHEEIIAEIRKFDADNIIVCGTPNWSQDVDDAAENPIEGENIAYTLHFYAGTHQDELMQKAEKAIEAGLPIIVTEFGTTEADGDGMVYRKDTQKWLKFMDKHKLSWCNWSIADKDEASAALKPGTIPTQMNNRESWTESGAFIREVLRKKHN